MVSKEKLYEAFGELVYAVAKADGIVQNEEVAILHNLLNNHAWASEIEWSFNYENSKNHSVAHVYKKALDVFQEHGPDAEYTFFVEVMELIANSNAGTAASEQKVIDDFQRDLLQKFKGDLNLIGNEE
jgi:uncharacterized tellurite resistance protein B-like protein